MRSALSFPRFALALLALLAVPAFSQGFPQFDPYNPAGSAGNGQLYESRGATVHVIVLNEHRKPLDQQAIVRVINDTTTNSYYGTTTDNAQADIISIEPAGKYTVEVSSFGYLTAHKLLVIGSAVGVFQVEVQLQPDPAAVNLNAVVENQANSKIRRQMRRGVTYIKSGDLKRAERELLNASHDDPNNAEAAFLLGFIELQRKDDDNARVYLTKAVTLDPRHVQALTMLGKLDIAHKEYTSARKWLEQAVLADHDSWNAQYLLANASLWLKDYAPARDHALVALDKGKGAASDAYLVLGQAEANLNHYPEAIAALKNYMQRNPSSKNLVQVQQFIEKVQHTADQAAEAAKAGREVPTTVFGTNAVIQAEDNIDDLRLAAKGWAPPGVDDAKPQVAADVPCPAGGVLDLTGKRVKELVDNVAKFAAIEEVMHENVDESGHPISHETRRYDYSAEILESQGALGVEEYRISHSDITDFPESIASRGFPALAMVFHPLQRENFQFTCEGLGQWKNQATWLVYFRQREDRPNKVHDYQIGSQIYRADLKGRAWIAADNFQIVHMESELVSPNKKIHLLTEHQLVDYGPVLFAARKEELWLPKSADLYIDFQRKRFHRRHSYDRFLMFAVDSNSKDKAPVDPAPPKPDPSPSGPQHVGGK